MRNYWLTSLLILVSGFAIGTFVQVDFLRDNNLSASTAHDESIEVSPVTPLDTDEILAKLADMQQQLDKTAMSHGNLAIRVEQLAVAMARPPDTESNDHANLDQSIDDNAENRSTHQANEWFDEQILVDSGMAEARAISLKQDFERLELRRLQLREQSIRENWDRDKLREEMHQTREDEEAMIANLDENEYDAYLYATQQPNRVEVVGILNDSQAQLSGLLPGDQIVRYDNQRIYKGSDLQNATTEGIPGEIVAIDIRRDDEFQQVYVVRGVLGIRMNSVSVKP